jgi:hypothetical protein
LVKIVAVEVFKLEIVMLEIRNTQKTNARSRYDPLIKRFCANELPVHYENYSVCHFLKPILS